MSRTRRLVAGSIVAMALAASGGPAYAEGTPGCPGENAGGFPGPSNSEQGQAGIRDDLVLQHIEAQKAAGSNFGQEQSAFNHTVCGHGNP